MNEQLIDGQLGFPAMSKIIPEGKSGEWSIEYYTPSEFEVRLEKLHSSLDGIGYLDTYLVQATYCVLRHNKHPVMSDTYRERVTQAHIIDKAHGNVLIAGLGIGLVLPPLCANPRVTSVTVLELEQDVINLVAPYHKHPKLKILHADVFEWRPSYSQVDNAKYDVIYFDIWPDISGDNWPDMCRLHRTFGRHLNRYNKEAFMDSWCREECKKMHRED